ncbi:hypothetical protein BJ085DRAFT_29621 [Dimargaris cristalligena]|uniref:Uncharacterized protein n=1 Tax=Dimargaris cristalligena TaxID=215637 RepID=A0A4Q0A264_9FUNG|nr:hypothetical protein BJ085DRAFT_29621 [Dimargaris cristalligena]|eukprot:RKP39260.1 hypothetical protein BJ085DRAFT_29621 [Dimargaris cristalligena]
MATLVVSVIETIIVVVMEAMVAYYFFSTVDQPFDSENTDKGIPIYLILFVTAQVYLLMMSWDAVKHRNSIQLIGVIVFNLCIFSYSVFQFFQINELTNLDPERFAVMFDNMRPFLIVIPCIVGTASLVYIWLGIRLHHDFGWDIFKQIGANASIRRMYRAYHVFVLLIKLDAFFFVGYAIQFIILVLRSSAVELWLTVAVVPVTLIVLLLAVYAVRYENKGIMLLFMVGLLACMAYFIYRLVRIYQPSQAQRYLHTSKFLTFFAVVSLSASVLTLIQTVICYRNFNRGLKDHFQGQEDEKIDYSNYPPVRMTLED